MEVFSKWLLHRSRALRLSWPDEVAQAAGLEPAALELIFQSASLRGAGRSARGYLARAMKVGVRELEALDSGRIQWIADERMVDLDALSPTRLGRDRGAPPTAVACDAAIGVRVLGRIVGGGRVIYLDDWLAPDGPRLPVRYPGLPDAFALELGDRIGAYEEGARLVFQTTAPGELRSDDLAVLTCDECPPETALWRVASLDMPSLRVTSAGSDATEPSVIELATIVRAARCVDSFS